MKVDEIREQLAKLENQALSIHSGNKLMDLFLIAGTNWFLNQSSSEVTKPKGKKSE